MKRLMFLPLAGIQLLTAVISASGQQFPSTSEQRGDQEVQVLESSTNEDERLKAFNNIRSEYRYYDPTTARAVAARLVEILTSPVAPGENWSSEDSARNLAIYLAGELRIEAAVPALIALLAPLPGQRNIGRFNLMGRITPEGYFVPRAGIALCKIGVPAEKLLEAALPKASTPRLRAFIKYVLGEVARSKAPDENSVRERAFGSEEGLPGG